MQRIVGFTGLAGAGKNEAANSLKPLGFRQLSFAEPIRVAMLTLDPIIYLDEEMKLRRLSEIVGECGWDVAKRAHPEIRCLLQRFGTEVGREQFGETFWVDRVMQVIDAHYKESFTVTDVRFPGEAMAIRERGGIVIEIYRDGLIAMNHTSENIAAVRPYVNAVVTNVGTIENLHEQVLELIACKFSGTLTV
jgi:hypothetical protein